MIAEILVENSSGVFRGKVGQDVYRFGVVPSRFIDIFVRLRVSSFDSKTACVLSMSPNSANSDDRWGQLIHIWCPGHSRELRGVYNKRQQLENYFWRERFLKVVARTVWT